MAVVQLAGFVGAVLCGTLIFTGMLLVGCWYGWALYRMRKG